MAFVPTSEQIDSLYFLLKQLRRENIEIRTIRFEKLAEKGINNYIVDVVCLEDEDRYTIFYNGRIELRYKSGGW